METIAKEICDYIEWLRNRQGLQVTLHPSRDNTAVTTNQELMRYNLHYNPYCLYLKTEPDLWTECVNRQKKVREKVKSGAFCGLCHAGVYEFVYPLFNKDAPGGFISVSGYHGGEKGMEKSRAATAPYGLGEEICRRLYRGTLHKEIPEKEEVDALIFPLIRMLELFSLRSRLSADTPGVLAYYDILQYINRHYTSQLTISQIAEKLHYSVSHISHLFKQNNGVSIPDYLNMMRVETAKDMLLHTDASIESVAFACGFNDASYFSSVFKKFTRLSPRAFRREKRAE